MGQTLKGLQSSNGNGNDAYDSSSNLLLFLIETPLGSTFICEHFDNDGDNDYFFMFFHRDPPAATSIPRTGRVWATG